MWLDRMQMSGSPAADSRPGLKPGTKVEVRNRFDGSWSGGFTVVEVVGKAYRLQRDSDGEPLPVPIPSDEVRRERTRQTWWI